MLDEVVREWKRFEEINESIDRIDFGLHVPRLTAGIFVPLPRCTHWLTGVAAAAATAVDRSRSVRAGIAASTAEVLAQQGSAEWGLLHRPALALFRLLASIIFAKVGHLH